MRFKIFGMASAEIPVPQGPAAVPVDIPTATHHVRSASATAASCTTMNSLYTLGVRQTTAIQADLDRMTAGDHSVSLQGHWASIGLLEVLT